MKKPMVADPATVLTWVDTPDVLGEIENRKRQSFTRIIEQLSHRLGAIVDSDNVSDRLTSLNESSLVNIASAPETHFQLTCPLRTEAQVANFMSYLDDSLLAEVARNDEGPALDRPVWTSKRDLHFKNDNGAARCCYAAPNVEGKIIVDAISPTARRRSDGTSIEAEFDRLEFAKRAEDLATRLGDSLSFVVKLSPTTHRLILTHLNAIVLQDDPKRSSMATISGRAFPGQAIFRNFPASVPAEVLVDSIIHESIHSYLYAVEQKRPWMKDIHHNGLIRSPWTSNELRIDSYLHACFVWFGLFFFWSKALESDCPGVHPFYSRARSGFLGENLAAPLRDQTANVDPVVVEQIAQLSQIVRSSSSRI